MRLHHSKLGMLLLCFAFVACSAGAETIKTITAEGLRARLQSKGEKPLVVDVREPSEFKAGHIDGALLAPLAAVEEKLKDVPKEREIVLVCRSGRRSGIAYQALAARGYSSMKNMEGGMLSWQKLGYPIVK